MKYHKQALLLLLILIIFHAHNIYANNLWIDFGVKFENNTLAVENKEYYTAVIESYNEDRFNKISIEDLTQITRIGPSLSFTYYMPFAQWLGIQASTEILFQTGFVASTTDDYTVLRNWNFKQNINFATTANWFINENNGLTFAFGGQYNYIQTSTENIKNNKLPSNYIHYDNWALLGKFGFVTKSQKAYFKLETEYAHSIINKESTFSVSVLGGFIL